MKPTPIFSTAFGRLLLLVVTALLAACGPEEFVVWAPDGEHAFVKGDASMLIDPQGRSSGALVQEHEDALAWMPDSRRVIITRAVPAQSWAEFAALLGPERTAFVVQASGQLAALIAEYQGDWRRFPNDPAVKVWTENIERRGEEISNIAYHLEQTHPGVLTPLTTAARQISEAEDKAKGDEPKDPERQGDEALIREDQLVPFVVELRLRQAVPLDTNADQLLLRVPDQVAWACAARTGHVIAFARQEPGFDRLYVLPATPGGAAVLVDSGAGYAAWSPDGQDLAYAKSTTPHQLQQGYFQLGTITARRVCTPGGDIIAQADSAEDFAGIILPERPARVAWLPDGCIIFAGAPLTLPATLKDMPEGLTLFALKREPEPIIERLLPSSISPALREGVSLFTVSPDGRKIAILGKSGAVSVFALETKMLTTLQDPIVEFENRSNVSELVPVWRTADELTYVVAPGNPAGSAQRAEVVLGDVSGARRAISKDWPANRFLPAKKGS